MLSSSSAMLQASKYVVIEAGRESAGLSRLKHGSGLGTRLTGDVVKFSLLL